MQNLREASVVKSPYATTITHPLVQVASEFRSVAGRTSAFAARTDAV